MSNDVMWVCTFSIDPKKFEDLKKVLDPLVSASLAEPGCINYKAFVNTDRTALHFIEHCRDSDAVVKHVNQTFSQFSDQFGLLATSGGFTVYGEPEGEARRILDGFGAKYLASISERA